MQLMGPRRHADLVKAASATVDLINDGYAPDSALLKAAQEHDLNAKEVALVSNTVNNALTVSHLADSEAEAKADPFPLTNADKVTQELFPSHDEDNATHNDPTPGKRPEGEDVESPLSLDPQDQVKKAASARRGRITADPDAYTDSGTYHDLDDGSAHVKVAAEAFGLGPSPAQARTTVAIGLGQMKVSREFHGDPTAGISGDRLVGNPYAKIRSLEKVAEEARTQYAGARDAAYAKLASLIETFRRTDAPSFARVESLAKHAGVSPGTIEVLWATGELDRVGHARGGQLKIAGVALCGPGEKAAVDGIRELETLWKQAAHCYAAQAEVEANNAEIIPRLAKLAADGVDIGKGIKATTDTIGNLPSQVLGDDNVGQVVGRAMGTFSENRPDYGAVVKSPLDVGARQRLANTSASASFVSLLDDDYIAARPITDIVRAYNKVMESKDAAMPDEMVRRLVKEQLATGEDLDVQTLLNLNKGKGQE
jgi:hypothetical protein